MNATQSLAAAAALCAAAWALWPAEPVAPAPNQAARPPSELRQVALAQPATEPEEPAAPSREPMPAAMPARPAEPKPDADPIGAARGPESCAQDLADARAEAAALLAQEPQSADAARADALVWRAAATTDCALPTPENARLARDVESFSVQIWARALGLPRPLAFDERAPDPEDPSPAPLTFENSPPPSLARAAKLAIGSDPSAAAKAWRQQLRMGY